MQNQHGDNGRPITLQDVADHCGVTKATVSRALNGNQEINEKTAARIRTAATELGYNRARFHQARRLAARKTGRQVLNHQVALILPAFFHTSHYFNALFNGILNVLTTKGYGISVMIMPDKEAPFPLTFHPSIVRAEVDGVIMVGFPDRERDFLPALRQYTDGQPCPVVTMIIPNRGCSAVLTDDARGGYLSARHLIELGHRHLVFVHNSIEYEGYFQRRDSMRQALQEAGIDVDPQKTDFVWQGVPALPHHLDIDQNLRVIDEARGEGSLLGFLRANPQITGIIAHNDITAIQIWYLLRSAGINIPQDISLIGYDGVEAIWDENGVNVLTTIRLPLQEVGQRSAELLLQHIDGEMRDAARILLPVELVVRATTGRVGTKTG